MTGLQTLNVSDTAITDAEVDSLRKALPGTNVVNSDFQ